MYINPPRRPPQPSISRLVSHRLRYHSTHDVRQGRLARHPRRRGALRPRDRDRLVHPRVLCGRRLCCGLLVLVGTPFCVTRPCAVVFVYGPCLAAFVLHLRGGTSTRTALLRPYPPANPGDARFANWHNARAEPGLGARRSAWMLLYRPCCVLAASFRCCARTDQVSNSDSKDARACLRRMYWTYFELVYREARGGAMSMIREGSYSLTFR